MGRICVVITMIILLSVSVLCVDMHRVARLTSSGEGIAYTKNTYAYGSTERERVHIYAIKEPVPYVDHQRFFALYIPGGGWREHRPDWGSNGPSPLALRLIKKGIVVVYIDFIPASDGFYYPLQLDGCRRALDFIISKFYPTRLFGWGHSAGAHLTLELANRGYYEGIGLWSTPADLTVLCEFWSALFGPGTGRPFAKLHSPLYGVTEMNPPALLAHGENDELVPFPQSERLLNQLINKQIPAELIPVVNGNHIFEADDEQVPVNPTKDVLASMTADFAYKTLFPAIRDPELSVAVEEEFDYRFFKFVKYRLSWTEDKRIPVDYYRIYRKNSKDPLGNFKLIRDRYLDLHFSEAVLLTANTVYHYRVTAVDVNGNESRW